MEDNEHIQKFRSAFSFRAVLHFTPQCHMEFDSGFLEVGPLDTLDKKSSACIQWKSPTHRVFLPKHIFSMLHEAVETDESTEKHEYPVTLELHLLLQNYDQKNSERYCGIAEIDLSGLKIPGIMPYI